MAISTIPYALIVDDDLLIFMHACDILEEAGFHFYEAGTGEEAKALLTHHADDVTLLFSDVEMPGDTDGFALAHYVADHWPWIEIVIASGNVKPGPRGHAREGDVHRQAVQRSDGSPTSQGEDAGQQATRAA